MKISADIPDDMIERQANAVSGLPSLEEGALHTVEKCSAYRGELRRRFGDPGHFGLVTVITASETCHAGGAEVDSIVQHYVEAFRVSVDGVREVACSADSGNSIGGKQV